MLKQPTPDLWYLEPGPGIGLADAANVRDPHDLLTLREQACRLLRRLERAKAMSEQRAAETGRRDPMKFVTGCSALDSAVAATRGMIDRMDALLAELGEEIETMARESRARINGEPACAGCGR